MLQPISMFLSWKENSKKAMSYQETIYSQSRELSYDPEQTEFQRGKGSTAISPNEGRTEREPRTVFDGRKLYWLSELTTPRNQPPPSFIFQTRRKQLLPRGKFLCLTAISRDLNHVEVKFSLSHSLTSNALVGS